MTRLKKTHFPPTDAEILRRYRIELPRLQKQNRQMRKFLKKHGLTNKYLVSVLY